MSGRDFEGAVSLFEAAASLEAEMAALSRALTDALLLANVCRAEAQELERRLAEAIVAAGESAGESILAVEPLETFGGLEFDALAADAELPPDDLRGPADGLGR